MKNILFLLLGIVSTALAIFGFHFKFSPEYIRMSKEMIDNIDRNRERYKVITKVNNYDLDLLNYFQNNKDTLMTLSTNFSDPGKLKSHGGMNPIPDFLLEKYRNNLGVDIKALNSKMIDNPERPGKSVKFNDDPWIHIPIADLMSYVSNLRLNEHYEKVKGVFIYMGKISSEGLPSSFVNKHEEYYNLKEGTIVPIFVASTYKSITNNEGHALLTVNGEDSVELTHYNNVALTDCNCGNPPNCNTREDAYRYCVRDICTQCPKADIK